MPYISSYIDFYEYESSNNTNGGLDLKYGINESFTLDVTLIPDFGQTVFDNQILKSWLEDWEEVEKNIFKNNNIKIFFNILFSIIIVIY